MSIRPILAGLCLLSLLGACEPGQLGEGGLAGSSPESAGEGGLRIGAPGAERPYFHDFGDLEWGLKASHVFEITNEEGRDVVFLDAQGACACTRVREIRYTAEDGEVVRGDPRAKDGMLTLPPGRTVEMVLQVDSTKVGQANLPKLEVMRLRTDSERDPYLTFEVRLVSRQLFQATPKSLDLGSVSASAGGDGIVDVITGVPGAAPRILGVLEQGEVVSAEVTETYPSGEPLWRVVITVPPLGNEGPLLDEIVLRTTGPDGEGEAGTLTIPVRAQLRPDVILTPHMTTLGLVTDETPGRAEFIARSLVPGLLFAVESTEVVDARGDPLPVDVTTTPSKTDTLGRARSWKVELVTRAGFPKGPIQGRLLVRTADEQHPLLEARLLGNAR